MHIVTSLSLREQTQGVRMPLMWQSGKVAKWQIIHDGDLRALKRGYCGESALRTIITRWRRDGWIEKTDSKHWHKLKVEN